MDASSPFLATALKDTVTAVKAGPGKITDNVLFNPNGSTIYVQFFDALAADVVLGTTPAKLSVAVPAGASVQGPRVGFYKAISIAATTTPGGLTAPSTGAVVNLGVR